MKKPLLSLLFVVLVACSLVLVNIVQLSGAQASGTNVSGIIYANTTWTLASSPYNLVGPVAVNTGVMLTIEAGTVVNLNGNYITVNGTFVAKGTSTTNIQFNGAGQSFGKIDLTALSNGWNDQTGSGSIIQYVTGSSTQISLESPAKIDHSTLAGDVLMSNVVQGSCGVISNNTITVSYGDGIICSGNASVLNNTVIGGNWGGIDAFSGSPTIQGNLVTGNTGWSGVMSQGGIVVRNGGSLNVPTTPIIEDNTVANNNIGITIGSQSSQTISPIILNNNIYSNQKYNFYLKQVNFNVSVTDNWWGTNDVQTINQTIYDFKNDFNLGNVTFIPVLTVADPAAPLADYNPNPTPTPSPTPTPTPSPTPSPSPNPAPTANPTPSPSPLSPSTTTSTPTPTGSPTPISTSSIPEFSSSVIFSIFTISTISAVIALMIRKRR